MVPDFPELTMDFRVRYAEVGPDALARLSAVADWFQEAAGVNASALGFGNEALFSQGLTWILTRMIFYVRSLPEVGQSVQVRTWPAQRDHLAHRGYELLDGGNEPLIRATGAWAIMDLATRRIVPMPAALAEAYPCRTIPYVPFLGSVTPRLRKVADECTVQARKDDLDMNGHVNNARYLGWLLEPVSEPSGALAALEVTFRAECLPGETLLSRCSAALPAGTAESGEPFLQREHAIVRTNEQGASVDVCRAVSRWRPAAQQN
ncbi:MAG TPA: acyl-ACP thioesterase [Candidatus Avidesulfovibrio excrementigallinarum]|nr:acyl-ACP thioesterase [Candidatus Avidesulfovibrio excrementigallinarum]